MDLFNDFTNFINGKKPAISTKASGGYDSFDQRAKEIYDTEENNTDGLLTETKLINWYTQLPYGFRFRNKTFYLPISPSNLNITTHFSTNVISTMYGTVEEHSEQRYYDISISGTTGMAPKYYKKVDSQIADYSPVVGRAGQAVKGKILGGTFGFFKRTQALVENTLNQVSDLLSSGPEAKAGVDLSRSGYVAFHNFYKFLLLHKKVATGSTELGLESGDIDPFSDNPGEEDNGLYFLNYKDNNQYNVAIQGFQLTRDAANPMLYNYSISMRAYNLKTVDQRNIPIDNTLRSKQLGLDSINTSIATKLANKTRQAKNAAYTALAAVKGFGA